MTEATYDWLGEEVWSPVNESLFAHLLTEKNTSVPITEEERKRVDGKAVLGIMEGCYGAPGNFSGNGRYYPKECFIGTKSCLESEFVKNKLESKTFFGTLGHEDKEIDEADITEGKHAINTYKMWIDESSGLLMGRAYILNTKSGWNLFSAMKSGSAFKMSSRARGSFQEGSFKMDENGVQQPVVDPATFKLFSFDVVFNPGFKQTFVNLKENKNNKKEEKTSMSLTEQEKDSKISMLERELNESKSKDIDQSKRISALNQRATLLEEEIDSLKESMDLEGKEKAEMLSELIEWREISEDSSPEEYSKELSEITKQVIDLKTENSSLKEQLSLINESSTDLEISEMRSELKAAEKIYSYIAENYGSLENIEKMLKKSSINENVQTELNAAEKIYGYIKENFGSLENIEKMQEELKDAEKIYSYIKENFGSLENIEKMQEELNAAEKIYSYIAENYGSLENIEKELSDAEKIYSYIVENFGSLKNIESELNAAEKIYGYIKENYGSLEQLESTLDLAEQKIVALQGGTINKDLLEREAKKISESLNNVMNTQEVFNVLVKHNGNLQEAEEKVFRHIKLNNKEQSMNENRDIVKKVKDSYINKSGSLLGGYFD